MLTTAILAAAVDPNDRAAPPCPHFGPCGGCQIQHLTYPAQLALKGAHLRELFEAADLRLPELQMHASPPLAYRNRIRLTLAEVDGQFRAGYIRTSGYTGGKEDVISTQGGTFATGVEKPLHTACPSAESGRPSFLRITECPIAAPILWRATEALLTLINENSAWLRSGHFTPDQLELFTTADESRLQFTLYVRSAARSLPAGLSAAFDRLCEALRVGVPQLRGAGIALLPTLSKQLNRRTEQARAGPAWGSSGLSYSVPATGGTRLMTPQETFWIPRGAFFQINRFLLPELLSLVCADSATNNRSGSLVWDLYAGVGLFSRVLARSFAQATVVEIAEPAASALSSTKLTNVRAVKATTLDFLRAAVVERDRPNLIVLDPPRTGAGPEVCALLGRIAAPTLVYVSCSPETLLADLATLTASGYKIAELHLVDLFPQTTHIETVAILSRPDRSAAAPSASVANRQMAGARSL